MMNEFEKAFEEALSLPKPWHVQKFEGDPAKSLLRVHVRFAPGSRFLVEGHDEPLPVQDPCRRSILT